MRAAVFMTVPLVVTAAALLAMPALPAQTAEAAGPDTLIGDWWTPGFGARVRIEPCGDAACGRIVWVWDEKPKDIADKSPLVGRKVITGMRSEDGARWSGGNLYNPEDGRDYKGTLHLQSPTRLVVDGCVLFVCKQQVWRRADAARCPPVDVAEARP
jgi:uncharacterized protein (DUF2147 family)